MDKMNQEVVEKLFERYHYIHPLIRHRSLEYAKSVGELFDILEEFPKTMPAVWNPQSRRWENVDVLKINRA